jgi:hypothetical protein
MKQCIHSRFRGTACEPFIQWEHAWIHAGKQIDEIWNIVPCCNYHNRAPMSRADKDFNKYVSLLRALQFGWAFTDLEDKYPRNTSQTWACDYFKFDRKFGDLPKIRQYKQVILNQINIDLKGSDQ